MHELENLVDTLHEIKFENLPDMEDEDNLTHEDKIEMVNTIIQLMYDYTNENARKIHEPSFHEDMMNAVEDLLETSFENVGDEQIDDVSGNENIQEIVSYAVDMFYMQVMPKRSYYKTETGSDVTDIFPYHSDRRSLGSILRYLKSVFKSEKPSVVSFDKNNFSKPSIC